MSPSWWFDQAAGRFDQPADLTVHVVVPLSWRHGWWRRRCTASGGKGQASGSTLYSVMPNAIGR